MSSGQFQMTTKKKKKSKKPWLELTPVVASPVGAVQSHAMTGPLHLRGEPSTFLSTTRLWRHPASGTFVHSTCFKLENAYLLKPKSFLQLSPFQQNFCSEAPGQAPLQRERRQLPQKHLLVQPLSWGFRDSAQVFKKTMKEDPGNYKPVSLNPIPGKVIEQILLEAISKHIKDKTMTFPGEGCLSNLIVFWRREAHEVELRQGTATKHKIAFFAMAFLRLLRKRDGKNLWQASGLPHFWANFFLWADS